MVKSKVRELLNSLNEGKIDTATTLLESIDAIYKPELLELAALFDQSKSPDKKSRYRLIIKRRSVGKLTEGIVPNLKAYENGSKVSLELSKLIAAGNKKNILQAVGIVMKNWHSKTEEKMPSQHTLRRDYNYYLKVKKLNPKFLMNIFPPLKNKSP